MKIGTLVDEVLRRTRDPQGLGTPRESVRLLVDHAARLVNMMAAARVVEREFVLEPLRTLYDLDEVVHTLGTPVARLMAIRVDGVDLVRGDWRDTARLDRLWLRRHGPMPHTWAPVGGNLFMVYPAPPAVQMMAVLTLVVLPPLSTSDDADVDMPEELRGRILDLAEAFVFMRRRQPTDVRRALERATVPVPEMSS